MAVHPEIEASTLERVRKAYTANTDELLVLLEDPAREVRLAALTTVTGKVPEGHAEACQVLGRLLFHVTEYDEAIRSTASWALAQIAVPEDALAVSLLATCLTDDCEGVRKPATKALAQMVAGGVLPCDTVEDIVSIALEGSPTEVRIAGVAVLAAAVSRGYEQAMDQLQNLMESEADAVVQRAIVVAMKSAEDITRPCSFVSVYGTLALGATSVHNPVRMAVVEALKVVAEPCGKPSAAACLSLLLEDSVPDIRDAAVAAVGAVVPRGDRAACATLQRLLGHKNWSVRVAVAVALSEKVPEDSGDELFSTIVEAIVALLEDNAPGVREVVPEALAKITSGARGCDKIVEGTRRRFGHSKWPVRAAAIAAYGKVVSPLGVEAKEFAVLLKDDQALVRDKVIAAMGDIAEAASRLVVSGDESAVNVVSHMHHMIGAVASVLETRPSLGAATKCACFRAFESLDFRQYCKEMDPAVLKYVKGEMARRFCAAKQNMEELPDGAWPAVDLSRWLEDSCPAVRERAVTAMGRLVSPEDTNVIDVIANLMADPSEPVRRAAGGALVDFSEAHGLYTPALKAARPFCDNKSQAVRRSAAGVRSRLEAGLLSLKKSADNGRTVGEEQQPGVPRKDEVGVELRRFLAEAQDRPLPAVGRRKRDLEASEEGSAAASSPQDEVSHELATFMAEMQRRPGIRNALAQRGPRNREAEEDPGPMFESGVWRPPAARESKRRRVQKGDPE